MRLVKQVRLHFQEGTSDKVYEIDLCEIGPGRFVVNYRFGRRGSRLRDGSHTASPVSLAEAERAFDALADSKRRKGYRDIAAAATGVAPPTRPTASAAAAAAAARLHRTPQEFREQVVLRRLQAGPHGGRWPIERAIWRAGELRVRGAAPVLLRLLGGGALRDYCIAWALGRLGDPVAVEPLVQLWQSERTPAMVRRIAAEALRLLSDDRTRDELARDLQSELPIELRRPAESGATDALLAALNKYLEPGDADRFEVLEQLYLINTDRVRPALLEYLRTAPLRPGAFQRLRHIFKAAEFRRDGEVFGLLAHRFAKEAAYLTHYSPRSRSVRLTDGSYVSVTRKDAASELQHPDSKLAYSHKTRQYLQLRVWRTLRRLGALGDRDFIPLAVGTLLPFTDGDAVATRSVGRNHWDAFSPYWAFNHLLYGRSARYRPQRNGKAWICKSPYKPGDAAPPVHTREESFPALWAANPGGLLHLLAESNCAPVHEFATKALRACPQVLAELDQDTLLLLLNRQYEVTAQLGCEVAASRYQPLAPDLALVLAVAGCSSATGRALAHRWIDEGRPFFIADGDFLFQLCTSRHADTRSRALQLLRSASLPDGAVRSLTTRLLAAAQALGTSAPAQALARDIASILLRGLPQGSGSAVRRVPLRTLFDLLRHPLSDVQDLAAQLLLIHETGVAALSAAELDELLRILLTSSFEMTRSLGMRLLGQVPDRVLFEQQELLRTLCTHALPDLRSASRPIIRRLAQADTIRGQQLVRTLISVLEQAETSEGVHAHVLRTLREDLGKTLSDLSRDDALRLCRSPSQLAVELGGHLLHSHPAWADDLPTVEIVALAHAEVKGVRDAACLYLSRVAPRLHADPTALGEAARILESKWDDAREYGFRMLRDEFGEKDFTPDLLIAICDSVRPDVQALGRELITRHFSGSDGVTYLLRLSEHPSTDLQLFATNYLERFAVDDVARLASLRAYFVSVLSRVNQARLAKRRVYEFLLAEACKSREAALLISDILARVSATIAIGDRARAIEAMLEIGRRFPDVPLPVSLPQPPLRNGAVGAGGKAGKKEARGAV